MMDNNAIFIDAYDGRSYVRDRGERSSLEMKKLGTDMARRGTDPNCLMVAVERPDHNYVNPKHTVRCSGKCAACSITRDCPVHTGEEWVREENVPLLEWIARKEREEAVNRERKDPAKIDQEKWQKFRNSGLFHFVNEFLHMFGYALQLTVEDGVIMAVNPERVKYRGFSEKSNEEAYRKVARYMLDNGEGLVKETETPVEAMQRENDKEILAGMKLDGHGQIVVEPAGATAGDPWSSATPSLNYEPLNNKENNGKSST